ncbi:MULTISPECIES: LysR family transcriptional regulator [unclassified Flavobacterium]|uniref:LysR family transcriptional regulator n=1 Tax=unclassified Flavobacterium TaxID=196869 RepID=UPI0012916799|nr:MULTISPECIES: LysR family transcriptional regulator [unclassified Flavobacterium]MQP52275.1 LysR family transcriptional regulator [Flavobacterium sp. LMO9]MQP62345.1 LysR family transcriptional regulator [Flavobacterium sp. LMO6]
MNYTLNQLRIFLKVVQNQSVTKASEELHLTQPAVSIQLKNFQDQFEIPLTEVIGRKIYVTDFGKEIAEAAEQILQQVGTINYKTLAYKGQLFGKIKIDIVSTGKYIMPYFLSDFLKLHPGVELEMDVTNKNKVVKSLQQNEIDFALVSILPEKLNVEKIDLMQNKLYFVGNMEEDFTSKKDMETILQKRPLLFREIGSGTRQTMERFIQKNAIKIEKKMELTSNEAVKQSILAGLGYSIMPLIGIRKEIQNKDLQIIPLKGLPIKTDWSLIWVKGKNHNPAALAYLEYLKKEKEAIIKNKFSWYETV